MLCVRVVSVSVRVCLCVCVCVCVCVCLCVHAWVHTWLNAGIKVKSIVSYNHLGNNDGKNLSQPDMFRSKEISKSNVVDDMVPHMSHMYYVFFCYNCVPLPGCSKELKKSREAPVLPHPRPPLLHYEMYINTNSP